MEICRPLCRSVSFLPLPFVLVTLAFPERKKSTTKTWTLARSLNLCELYTRLIPIVFACFRLLSFRKWAIFKVHLGVILSFAIHLQFGFFFLPFSFYDRMTLLEAVLTPLLDSALRERGGGAYLTLKRRRFIASKDTALRRVARCRCLVVRGKGGRPVSTYPVMASRG